MGGEAGPDKAPQLPVSNLDAANGFWQRVQDQKLIQWGLAYLGGALAFAHGAELLGHAFHWPEVFWRIVVITLVIGFPIALTLAWYHGHRGLKQVGAGELMMISVLALIGAVFFTAALRPEAERDFGSVPSEAESQARGRPAELGVETPASAEAANAASISP